MPPKAKRRKIETVKVEEITFDLAARQEFLTGFHKRKLERAKHAREIAEKKARAERIEERKRLRDERKAQLEQHVQQVNALLRPETEAAEGSDGAEDNDEAQEWTGIEEPPPIDHEAEYIDEDRYTTVTVEEMDVSKEGIHKAEEAALMQNQIDEAGEEGSGPKTDPEHTTSERKAPKRTWTKERPKDDLQRRKKKKNFRYENKAERKVTRMLQRSKNSKQAKARREK